MSETDDMACLREYVRTGSQPAFAQIVRRRQGLVYSAAMRQVRDPHVAEDVTQTVFIVLERKAAEVINRDVLLSAWLLTTARFAAIDAKRRIARRRKHERQAAGMKREAERAAAEDFAWSHMRPLLDDAIDALRETDRRAIVLRYFEGRSIEGVANALGCTSEAARQRLWRAVERLRTALGAKGAVLSADVVASLLSKHAVEAPPAMRGSASEKERRRTG